MPFSLLAQVSVLSSGKWIKLEILEEGLYKISYKKLSELGFANPENVRVFANDFGMLNFYNNEPKPDDLREKSVFFENGFLYFFSRGKDVWYFDESDEIFLQKKHLYSNSSYVFLTEDVKQNTNLVTKTFCKNSPEKQITHGLFCISHQEDTYNFLKSGRNWYGENFLYNNQQNFKFNLTSEITSEPIKLKISTISASKITSSFDFSFNEYSNSILHSAINSSNNQFADSKSKVFEFSLNPTNLLDFNLKYNKNSSSSCANLDFFTINFYALLKTTKGKYLNFRHLGEGTFSFFAENNLENPKVFRINSNSDLELIDFNIDNSKIFFSFDCNYLEEFLIVSPKDAYDLSKAKAQVVDNQNLHSLPTPEYLIICPSEFAIYANQIKSLHPELNTLVVPVNQIYNEFSGGMVDVSAIRNFIKFLYDKSQSLKYVLLLGSGSVDNITQNDNNTNLIPTYQSLNSLNENNQFSFFSDDYFALLGDNEGEYFGDLDVSIARAPVRNVSDCQAFVNKLEKYISAFSPRMQTIAFIADDQDNNNYMKDAEYFSHYFNNNYPNYNIEKFYLDSYKQISNSATDYYPLANKEIYDFFQQGSLLVNYIGHANSNYLAHEKIITAADFDKMTNIDNLPIFITATCDVGRFDEYNRQENKKTNCLAENALFNPKGGVIALVTATRKVFANGNFAFNNNLLQNILDDNLRLGDIFKLAKNLTNDYNMHSFALLGDPALKIKLPKFQIKINKINNTNFPDFSDTLRPLDKVKLECEIFDNSFSNINFNGKAFIKIFDKEQNYFTLANDAQEKFEYSDYKNLIFNGVSKVENNRFIVEFIVPKDINHDAELAKFSFYAVDSLDNNSASARFDFYLGGKSNILSNDIIGPEIFVSTFPYLSIKLRDESGINICDYALGHNIFLSVDDNQTYNLNNYFTYDENSYTSGSLKYVLDNITTGNHTLKIVAFDNYNNSSVKIVDFRVYDNNSFKIIDLYNYPNPSLGNTTVVFKHNINQDFEYNLEIFNSIGQKVQSINAYYSDIYNGFIEIPCSINSSGVYIYRIKITTKDHVIFSKAQKMIILK